MPPLHISQIKLSAVRGINRFVAKGVELHGADANFAEMPRADTAAINVFAGPNGAGKSTFLDAIRVLGDADLLLTLRPSALSGGAAYHSFRLLLSDRTVVNVHFEEGGKVALRYFDGPISEGILHDAYPAVGNARWIRDGKATADLFFNKCALRVDFWPGPGHATFDSAFFDELARLVPYLTGVSTIFPAQHSEEETIITLLNDPAQSHLIQVSDLPAGWRAAAGLLAWTRQRNPETLCVIEEPETHLHPVLQRRVPVRLAELAGELDLQIFLSTHSAVFIHPSSWQVEESCLAIFHVDGRDVVRIDKAHARHGKLLDELGGKVSDLLQANCVIWVEGPSDRIYIRHWLDRWSAHQGLLKMVENVHYVFSFYGGSVLSHFDAGTPEDVNDAVSLLKVNRHSFVVMDRDHDFMPCFASGTFIRAKSACAKYKVIDKLRPDFWVTAGYTIESYLPEKYFDEGYLLKRDVDRVDISTKLSKVNLARKYERDSAAAQFSALFGANSPQSDIARLHAFILAAN